MTEAELQRRARRGWQCCDTWRKFPAMWRRLAPLRDQRQCYYGWLRRCEAGGLEGLKDRSQRPHRSPRATQAEVVEALVSVVATSYLLGVSTRRMEKLVQTWASPGCRSRGCRRWPKISTHRWRRSGTARWTPARTPPSPPTRWC